MTFIRGRLFRRALAALLTAPAAFGSAANATPAVVIDVASGQILQQDQPTASWYPASLTKLMTAYVALNAVRQRRIDLDTPLVVSPRATRMSPSKMGFRVGAEVTLRNALVMLMVKSANDIAVTIAEGVSGSVEAFADEMNRASASLGMQESHWVNPNGLPDSRQVTSARDLAILGRALLLDFPEHAWLYNIGAMRIGARIMPTHNGLLGRYPGADGMKTGFTCPAGFNLVASATHGGQRLIAVVLGAPSAAARTAKAAALLDRAFHTGAAGGSIVSLPTVGVSQAPDMRDSVCHHRGKATADFMATEVEEMSIPIGSAASTGLGLLDALGGVKQAHISVKDIARLPRPQFEAVPVYVGRTPGYQGVVARARAPGAPVGEQPDLAAFASETPEADASPISHAAADAAPLRGRAAKAAAKKEAKEAKAQGKPAAAHAKQAGKAQIAKAQGGKAQGGKKPEAKKETKKQVAANSPGGKPLAAGKRGAKQ
jgi:D-alanyl-D-alanine carboxypeptidase